jgi:RNA polymerase sigma factor (sigma-70 family)
MHYKNDNQLKSSSADDFYAAIYQRYAPALFAYVYQHTSSREDAEDIVLNAFLSVWQNQQFPTFAASKQAAWLWTITRNKMVDHYRHTARRPQVSIEWLTEPLYADEGSNPEQVSLVHEEYAQLIYAVRGLPKIQQDVLRLRFSHGLNSDEIGSVLEKSGTAVRMLLSRSLRRLRKHYQNHAQGGAQ